MRYFIEKPISGRYRGIEFSVDDSRINREYLDDYLESMKQSIDEGVEFEVGTGEMTLGWMSLAIVRTSDDYLQIQEPDFVHMPIRWINTMNKTFLDFQRQAEVAKQLRMDADFCLPSIEHPCLVCSRYFEGEHFEMERLSLEFPEDSGWYIGCSEPSHNHNVPSNLGRVSLYEAALRRPSLAQFVGLPVGTALQISPTGFELMPSSKD